MASTKEYLDFVFEQLSEIDEISYKAMMGIRKGGEKLKKKKSYIYTRVSAAAQTEGYSLDAQKELTDLEKKQFLRTFIESIELCPEEKVKAIENAMRHFQMI